MRWQDITERTRTAERHTVNTSKTSTGNQIEELQAILDEINALKQWMEDEDIVAQEAAELGES